MLLSFSATRKQCGTVIPDKAKDIGTLNASNRQ